MEETTHTHPLPGVNSRPQVHGSTWHFFLSLLANKLIRLFDKGARDYDGQIIKHGDRVFDIDYRFWNRTVSNKANYGTLYASSYQVGGDHYTHFVRWENGDETFITDPSRLLKWTV